MASEIEVISHRPPYSTPPDMRTVSLEALPSIMNEYLVKLNVELIDGYKELVQCVNTLFDRFNRFPIGPEITTPATGLLAFTDEGSGVVSIDIDQSFLMRGNLVVDTNDFTESGRQFTTTLSSTYHARWDATNGLRYRDLADAGYNPSALPATDDSFQSTDTDILLQQIDTDGANSPTFTAIPQFARSVTNGQTQIPNDVLITPGVGDVPQMLIRDTKNTGTGAQSSLLLQDSTPTTQGTLGFTSGADSAFELTNNVSGANLELNVTGAGQVVLGGDALVVGDTPDAIIRDDQNTGTAAQTSLLFQDDASTTQGTLGFTSGSDSVFELTNNVTDADVEINVTGDGDIVTNADILRFLNGANVDMTIRADGANGLSMGSTTPLFNIRDTGDTGDSAQPRLRFLGSVADLLGDMGYPSTGNSDMVLRNFRSGATLELLTTGSSHFILTQNGNSIHVRIGTAAPTASDPDGSLAVDINGGAGAVLYVREAGSWAAK